MSDHGTEEPKDELYKEHLEGAERLLKIRRLLVETQHNASQSPVDRKRKRSNDEQAAIDGLRESSSGTAPMKNAQTRSASSQNDIDIISRTSQDTKRIQPTRSHNQRRTLRTEERAEHANQAEKPIDKSRPCATSRNSTSDPMIYPGLYAPSGFDMLSILLRVVQRPNPIYNIGFVDSSCALVLCALPATEDESDTPIVYCSDAFSHLTHYQLPEIVGRNCRFLQSPDGTVNRGEERKHVDSKHIYDLKLRLRREKETQTRLVNYKKGGEKFINLLTTIEIEWGGDKGRYIVGFQAQGKDE